MSYRLTAQVIGAEELAAAFRRAPELVGQELKRAIDSVAYYVEGKAKGYAPHKYGNLRSSITTEPARVTVNNVEASVGTNLKYACVFDSATRVVTKDGFKTIGQIRVGDMVLTQTGDYQPVIAKYAFPAKEKPDLVDILVEWRKGISHKLTVTSDHKILTFREGRNKWIPARELTKQDLLYVRIKTPHNKGSGEKKTCLGCGILFSGQNKKYCKLGCKIAHWANGANPHIGMKRSAEVVEKLRALTINRLKERPESHPNRVLAQRGFKTQYELAIKEWLDKRAIKYKEQYEIGEHFIDFYLPDLGLALEADGAYWHKNQEKDIKRDRAILSNIEGLTIIHLHFYDKRFSPTLELNPLKSVYYVSCNPGPDSYVDPQQFRQAKIVGINPWRYGKKKSRNDPTRAKLYDLTIANVHSFLANGILVSNSYQEQGTGIYGPREAFITPKNGRFLAWKSDGVWHFAKRVRGVRPKWYFKRAKEESVTFLTEQLRGALGRIVTGLAK